MSRKTCTYLLESIWDCCLFFAERERENTFCLGVCRWAYKGTNTRETTRTLILSRLRNWAWALNNVCPINTNEMSAGWNHKRRVVFIMCWKETLGISRILEILKSWVFYLIVVVMDFFLVQKSVLCA